MKFTLKDYQADAVDDLLRELAKGRDLFHAEESQVSSVSLSATTGAGKTVMAAAVIEALFWGSEKFDVSRYHTCGAISRDGAVCRRAEGHTRYHWGDHPDPEGFGQVAWWNEDPTKWETYRWERR